MIEFIIYSILYLCIAFLVVMKLATLAEGKKWEPIVKYGFVYPFVIFDWFMNQTVFRLLMWDKPADNKELVTGRFKRYFRNPTTNKWRMGWGRFLEHIADLVDPGHFR